MASRMFCNRCFQEPQQTTRFNLTSCGHVYCDVCLCKGKRNECVICKASCRTISLTKQTDSNVLAFFMGIDGLCAKYSKETSQISEFQEKHRRRLLAFYRERICKLEEALQKAVLRIEQLQRTSLWSKYRAEAETLLLTAPQQQADTQVFPHSACSKARGSPTLPAECGRLRKPDVAAGPTRISLISPPQDGRMGSVSHRGPQHLGLTPSPALLPKPLRAPPLQLPFKGPPPTTTPPPLEGRAARTDSSPSLRGSQNTPSSQTAARGPPISIAGLLQRQLTGRACPLRGVHAGEVTTPLYPGALSRPSLASLCLAPVWE
ncbi:putative E3 SUMO-protein ligase RNF212 [Tenrec ecaudatus]|uniref:putative E3 SUMO-protein ligase RNF212 n=1 Tax=Tenrec ecaudatus TaxID=94439 RepID=UPI003F5A756C